jgi:GNAT superfamily N-acetyltransferase
MVVRAPGRSARGRLREGPLRLADGRLVWLRALRRDDAPRLLDLSQRLSAESLRRRFLHDRPRLDAREAERLAAVDHRQRVAIAVTADPSDDSPILAVGRFHGDGSDHAELALVVEDAYQHLGIGRLLLDRLCAEAARRRLRVLDGYVLYDNAPVLKLLRTSGHPLEVRWDGGNVLSIHLALA